MRPADAEPRLSLWLRVRDVAVPPLMITAATRRRERGDWAGACAAARADVDLRAVARRHGIDMAAALRDDLRHLAPDLLRGNLPRIAPHGLLRPGCTVLLARYRDGVHLVARTPPAWAGAGQRFSLALRDGRAVTQHPDRRFRLDLHRHLWDARRAAELAARSGGRPRWVAEARLLLRADRDPGTSVEVRTGRRRQHLDAATGELTAGRNPVPARRLPLLPDAATWEPPDLALLRAGLIGAGDLHPLLSTVESRTGKPAGEAVRSVECRGVPHRIGLRSGRLTPLDHEPAEIRREEMLAALGGPPLPCLQVIGAAHRDPAGLPGIRARLDHGDLTGALAEVEALLGPAAVLPGGPLCDELRAAAERRVAYGLFRDGMAGFGPPRTGGPRP